MRTRVLRSSPISTFGTLRSVSFFSSAPCFPILWLNPGLFNQSTNDRRSVCCQSVHSADLKILILENVQVLLTGDNRWGGISVPLGRNVSRGRPRTSKWAFASHQSGGCVAGSCGRRSPRKWGDWESLGTLERAAESSASWPLEQFTDGIPESLRTPSLTALPFSPRLSVSPQVLLSR